MFEALTDFNNVLSEIHDIQAIFDFLVTCTEMLYGDINVRLRYSMYC